MKALNIVYPLNSLIATFETHLLKKNSILMCS